jgi:hypothetical protein
MTAIDLIYQNKTDFGIPLSLSLQERKIDIVRAIVIDCIESERW